MDLKQHLYTTYDPETIRIRRDDDRLYLRINGMVSWIERIASAFPQTHPEGFVSFMDATGHEMGMVEDVSRLDDASRSLLKAELKKIYFVPTIREILTVETYGVTHHFSVVTDDGPYEFDVANLDALDGEKAPGVEIRSTEGKCFWIGDYWELSKESQAQMASLVPRKVLRARYGNVSSGSRGRGSSGGSRGGMTGMARF